MPLARESFSPPCNIDLLLFYPIMTDVLSLGAMK